MSAQPIPFPVRRVSGFDEPPPPPRAAVKPKGLPPAPGEPTALQRAWLARALDQAGGKLPLFMQDGQKIDPRTVKSCLEKGWCEPWYSNPMKPDWLVCKITDKGRALFETAA